MTAQLPVNNKNKLYEKDFCLWIETTANLLKEGKFSELDIEHLVEEIETMGRNEKNALESNLIIIFLHLLKWQYQPNKRSRSWQSSIFEHRRRLNKAFNGLRPSRQRAKGKGQKVKMSFPLPQKGFNSPPSIRCRSSGGVQIPI